jgi:transcriptional regulator with XRE-family HTH domain
MSIGQRLSDFIESVKKNQTQAAKELNVAPKTLNSVILGHSKPGYKVLEPLARLGVNINWLLTGEGEMMRSESPKNISGDGNLVNVGQHTNSTNTIANNTENEKEITYLKDKVKLLEAQLADKERLIQMYEAKNK